FTFAPISIGFIVRSLPASVSWLPKSWRDGFNSWIAGGEDTEEFAVGRMIDAGQEHYSTKVPGPEQISEEALSDLDMPVLAIIAGDSVVHDAQDAAEVAERTLTHGTVELYEGASHAVGGQESERVAADIGALIDAQD
ncbi:MAG TPA: alpha/beta hydrolase, partial [Beutenbergiaceae bacterium]|nr:alpha/beta hydrolase [Beutenbergiaceae bacterium]